MNAPRPPSPWIVLSALVCAGLLLGCSAGGSGRGAGSTMDEGGPSEAVEDADSRDFETRSPLDADAHRRGALQESERLAEASRWLEPVFFAFDRSELGAEARATLASNASWLRANTDVDAWIEGHCDERGTDEYNLALGERRARAVRDYLVQSGVAADRLRVVSYGEEKPFALGHDESAWSLNRRAHFRPSIR